jgi:hypothetical protein
VPKVLKEVKVLRDQVLREHKELKVLKERLVLDQQVIRGLKVL